MAHHLIDFLVVDHQFIYHEVLSGPVLKELWAIISIHHPCMKFPTEKGIATIQGDQMESRGVLPQLLKKVSTLKCECGNYGC